MPTYRNTDYYPRVWTTLTDPRTGTTLQLNPGETVELRQSINDPYLQLVPAKATPAPAPSTDTPVQEATS